MATKKKTTKKETSLVIKDENKMQEMVNMFAGSSALLQNDKEVERNLILRVAEFFTIPAVCVNVMGGLPYINKDGLLYKLMEYEGDKIVSLNTKMLQLASGHGEKAIAEATLIFNDGRNFTAVGEADENSVKLQAVKMTPNMMAETRAQNRVIRKAIQARMIKEMYARLGDKKSPVDYNERLAIENSVVSSAEEMSHVDKKETKEVITSEQKTTIKKAEAISKAFEAIQNEKNPKKLEEYLVKVKEWKFLSDNEKTMLTSAIEQRISKQNEETK